MLLDEYKYHLSECLYRDSHEKKSEDSYDQVSSYFSESFDSISSEHHDKSGDETGNDDGHNTVEYTIAMHRYHIGDTGCWECKWENERDDESLIEVLIYEMVTLDFVYFCCIYFLSLYHRKGYEKKDNRTSDTKILCPKSEKCEEILS